LPDNKLKNRRPVPGRPHHPRVPLMAPPTGDPVSGDSRLRVRAAEMELRAKSQAAAVSLVHRGFDEIVDVTAAINNPVAVTTLVSFTVPTGLVAKFERLAVVYSEPLVAMSQAVAWELRIDGGQLPHVSPYGYTNFGSLFEPLLVDPIWVQSGSTIAVVVIPEAWFDNHLRMLGRLGGRLYKPAHPDAIPLHAGDM